jgi:cytochrome bd-type quinol oxidase subunit 2
MALLCFLTAIWSVNSGLNGLTLHSWLSIAEVLVSLYVLYVLAMSVLLRVRLKSNSTARRWNLMPARFAISAVLSVAAKLLSRLSTITLRTRGVARYWPVWFMSIIVACVIVGASRIPTYPTVELHNVRVEKQVAANEWLMTDATQGQFLFTACHDFPAGRVIWAGYVARKVRYEERGNCKSIQRADLGFWWLRDSDGNAKEIGQ